MRVTFQIIQAYSKQSIPSIALTFESRKYLFNAPEPLQRIMREHSVKNSKGTKIFITQISTNHISGIFGLLLTLYENRLASEVQLYGPPGFSNYFDNFRTIFGHRILAYSSYDFFNSHQKLLGIKSLQMMNKVLSLQDYNKIFFNMNDYLSNIQKEHSADILDPQDSIKEDKFYKDENLEIHPVLLISDSTAEAKKPTLCYICKVNKVPGKINKEKLKEFNVPVKFVAKIVEAGELEVHGVLYKAKDFQEPAEPSPIVIIVDCPGKDYIESLINYDSLTGYFEGRFDKNEQVVKAMIHMAPIEVLTDPRYSAFLSKFDQECQHVFVNDSLKVKKTKSEKKKGSMQEEGKEEKKETEMEQEGQGQKKQQESASETEEEKKEPETKAKKLKYKHFELTNLLAKYFPKSFPVLGELPRKENYDIEEVFPNLLHKTVNSDLEFFIASAKQQGFMKHLPSTKNFYLHSYKETEHFITKHKKSTERLNEKPTKESEAVLRMFKECDPEVVFLGTASMMPSAYRNVSAIYLRFWQQEDTGILLDCGEGTYFQMIHHYGYERARELLKNLSVIFITHVHADHHLGTMKIVAERQKILEEENIKKDPIFLVIPHNCLPFMTKYGAIDNLEYKIVFNQDINVKKDLLILNQAKQIRGQQHNQRIKLENAGKDEDAEFECYDDPEEGKAVSKLFEQSISNLSVFEKFLLDKLGIKAFKTVDVNHCHQACGVLIEHKDGWKFAYSGDTRPSKNMIENFSPVTVLVHEATFTHNKQASAIKKAHSTDKEAIEVGMAMGAWRTVLTHFSQRYAKSFNINETEKKMEQKNRSKSKGKEKMENDTQGIQEEKLDEEMFEKEDRTTPYYNYLKHSTVRACDHFRFKLSELEQLPVVSRCLAHMPFEEA